MITTPIFTRLLTTAEYGQYNVFNSWYGIATIIISLYLSGGVHQQGLVKFDKDRAVFSSSMKYELYETPLSSGKRFSKSERRLSLAPR